MHSRKPGFELQAAARTAAPPTAAPTLLDGVDLFSRLDAICSENEMIGRELLRCHDQLNLMFEISEQLAPLDDPQQIEQTLVQRWGALLDLVALWLVEDGQPPRLLFPVAGPPPGLATAHVCDVLAGEIGRCRSRGRTSVPALPPALRRQLDGVHVLLGALPRHGTPPAVLVGLRSREQAPFDTRDVFAANAVLSYGGHVLRNVQITRRLQDTAFEAVRALAHAIDAKDAYTRGHSERVGHLGRRLGAWLELSAAQCQTLEWGGLLHDIGKIGISETILHKQGQLTPEEYAQIKRHPLLSYEVLRPIALLAPVLDAVVYHHENHDGSGYPAGLAGEAIPLTARIIHVVDMADALTSTRSYRPGFGLGPALQVLREGAGKVTDPRVTRAFIDMLYAYIRDEPADFDVRFAHLRDDPLVAEIRRPAAPHQED